MDDSGRAVRQFERFLFLKCGSELNASPVPQENWELVSTVVYNPENQTSRVERAYDD